MHRAHCHPLPNSELDQWPYILFENNLSVESPKFNAQQVLLAVVSLY